MPDLGKYAFSILTAYGVTITLLLSIIVSSLIRANKTKKQLAELEAKRNA